MHLSLSQCVQLLCFCHASSLVFTWVLSVFVFLIECICVLSVLKRDTLHSTTTSKFVTSVYCGSVVSWSVCGGLKSRSGSSCFECSFKLLISLDVWLCQRIRGWMNLYWMTRIVIIQITHCKIGHNTLSLKPVWLLCVMADLIDLKGLNISSL